MLSYKSLTFSLAPQMLFSETLCYMAAVFSLSGRSSNSVAPSPIKCPVPFVTNFLLGCQPSDEKFITSDLGKNPSASTANLQLFVSQGIRFP